MTQGLKQLGKFLRLESSETDNWEMSRDGKKWEVDFDLSYKKVND